MSNPAKAEPDAAGLGEVSGSELTGVPETMLWTLHNRAGEALRPDAILDDPRAIAIYQAIDYDYAARFGPAEPSHAVRAVVFDEQVSAFLQRHPDGVVINLGEGLETQLYRVAERRAAWVSVDLPEAIAFRERFIEPDEGHPSKPHLHVAGSASDRGWIDTIERHEATRGRPAIVTAQGLFMYFDPEAVARTIAMIVDALPTGVLVFDTIPVWFSKKTTRPGGWRWTDRYTMPPMPWGIDRHRIAGTIRGWSSRQLTIEEVPFFSRWPRGAARWLAPVVLRTPIIKRYGPAVTRVAFGDDAR